MIGANLQVTDRQDVLIDSSKQHVRFEKTNPRVLSKRRPARFLPGHTPRTVSLDRARLVRVPLSRIASRSTAASLAATFARRFSTLVVRRARHPHAGAGGLGSLSLLGARRVTSAMAEDSAAFFADIRAPDGSYKFLVDGEWRVSSSGRTCESVNPLQGEPSGVPFPGVHAG